MSGITNKSENSESEVVYKVVLEISAVGSSRHVTFDIKNYPEDFGEPSNPIEMDDLPESYKIMQQIMNFITLEVGKEGTGYGGPQNHRKN
jgi:hypothetical protein